jgi:hypothetical protein
MSKKVKNNLKWENKEKKKWINKIINKRNINRKEIIKLIQNIKTNQIIPNQNKMILIIHI